MKLVKKVLITGMLTTVTLCTMVVSTKAATVKVTGDTLNIRKGPSTDEKVVAMINKNTECELIGEEEEWYQVKYKNYTGYISKQYAQIVETSDEKGNENNQQNNDDKNNDNDQDNNDDKNNDNNQDNNENNDNNQDNNDNENHDDNQQNNETNNIIYKKVKQNIDVKILPLIHSSKIGEIKKESRVILLTQTTLWSYIQSNEISGWVRNEYLDELANSNEGNTNNNNSQPTEDNNQTNSSSEKIAYINEDTVNLRKGAGTNKSIIKVLTLNTQITIIGEEGTWYKVKVGNDTGYVSKEFVSDTKKVTSRGNVLRDETQEQQDSEQEEKQENKSQQNSNKEQEQNNNSSEVKEQSSSNTTTKSTDIIAYAKQYLGHKYVYGGDGSNGTFDCSGFTMYVYKHFGINLPHGATSQYNSGKGSKVSKQSDLQMGDIVFLTEYSTGKGIGHCGIYIGNGNFIHASTTSYTVTISSLNTTYKGRFYAGLRLI